MKDSRVITPSALGLEVLDKVNTCHQCIYKSRETAKEDLWWIGLIK